MLTLRAPAKINLTLEVLRRRPDGYHDIASVLQTIALEDILTIEPAPDTSFTCDHPGLSGPDNLVVKAAHLLQAKYRVKQGALLHLQKRIPVAAGLGGGSSDAAAALRGLVELWDLHPTKEEIAELAQSLGSDVPFFLRGGTAVAEGRGERLTPLRSLPPAWAVVLHPPLTLEGKTGRMYAALQPGDFSSGQATFRLARAVEQGEAVEPSLFHNCFHAVATRLFSQLKTFEWRFLEAGAPWVSLAGSGPCLFTLVMTRAEAGVIHQGLLDQSEQAYMAETVPRVP